MSYSVEAPCHDCKKARKCHDVTIVRGAVQMIHDTAGLEDNGHLGYGTVKVECGAHEKDEDAGK